ATGESKVTVNRTEKSITVGNDFMSREYSIENGKIKTKTITNNRIQGVATTINPAEGSEDFVISVIPSEAPKYEVVNPTKMLDRSNWTAVTANGQNASAVLDGNPNTKWEANAEPGEIIFNLQSPQTFSSFSYQARQDGFKDNAGIWGSNGIFKGYEVYTSEDGQDWELLKTGELDVKLYNIEEENKYNRSEPVYVNFGQNVTTQYLKLVCTSQLNGKKYMATASEFALYEDQVIDPTTTINPIKELDRSTWSAEGNWKEGFEGEKLLDGDLSTYWEAKEFARPMTVVFDLKESKTFNSFSYQAAQNGTLTGVMHKANISVSDDNVNWTPVGSSQFNYSAANDKSVRFANLDTEATGRYVKFDVTSMYGTVNDAATGAEFRLYEDKIVEPSVGEEKLQIKTSDLVLEEDGIKEEKTEDGYKVTFDFIPYEINGVDWDVDYVVVMDNGDHYMRSFMEINIPEENYSSAKIDYIDTDKFVLGDDINRENLWSHPDLKDVSSMWIGKNELMLGQPIYANGMFLGSEFPAADTDVVNNEMQIRYYSGKDFNQLKADNQLTKDGKFVSWQNVVGAAKGEDTDVVQTDFYEYISDIATPTKFRKQYNSWYDNMMGITDESIAKSFYGSEKGLTQNGVEPLDSYVVDDGWNNYRDEEFNPNIGKNESGEGFNRTGFWEFNSKFPNELYTSTELTSKFQSKFGVWLGPQGGYNFFGGFGKYLEKMGTGYKQSDFWDNVCVGSDRYVKNLTTMFIDYQNRFDVDYWKIDGFAVRPCTSTNHDHMAGGTNNMYYTTDLWEKWTDAWELMRENRASQGKDLFINATCYVNLSPWLLQWVNTIWVQDSGDTGQAGTGSRYQQKLTYRDNVYYNLLKVNQVQFPLKNIYNHDPIYGVSDGSSATTEDFRDFLFVNAVRGTAFWELYYSPSIMNDEKWRVNADAIDFAEKNAHILENAKLFGTRPTQDVYGYSCWDGNEGIVAFRNPTGEEKQYTLQLTDVVGVPTSVSNLKGNQVLPYVVGDAGVVSYGDEVTVTLAPYESKIIQYGNKDTEAAEVVSAKVTGNNEITIKYNERVGNLDGVYSVDGTTISSVELLEDYRTLVITTEDVLANEVKVNINGESDSVGNLLNTSLEISVYEDGKVINITASEDLVNGNDITPKYNGNVDSFFFEMDKEYEVNTEKSFQGTTDFAVNMTVNTTSKGVNLLSQGDDIQLSIDEEGYVNFKVKDLTVSSKSEVTTVVEKAHGTFGTDAYVPTSIETTSVGKVNDGKMHSVVAVREVNGMIKIYIDGELANSEYDKAIINQPVQAGKIIVADNNFNGVLGGIELRNSSIYYDEAKADYAAYSKVPVVEYDRETWTASACSEMSAATGDGPAASAIDGNENSWWHTNYVGSDTHTGKHWLSVDFGSEIEFDSVNLLSRGKSTNGSIKGYKLEGKVNGEWVELKSGELVNGTTDKIELDAPVTASAIKITSLSTFNGQNFAAIKEITVAKKDRLATEEEIKEVASLIKEVNYNDYTVSTANRYKASVEKVTYLDTINTEVLKELKAELLDAYNSLVEIKELNKVIADAKNLKEEEYTAESWLVFANALNTANRVASNSVATQEEVNEAKDMLLEAIDTLVKGGNEEIIVSKPSSLKAEASKNSVKLSWKAPEHVVGLAEYIIYKDGVEVDRVSAEVLEANVDSLKSNSIYGFKIVASYSNGENSKPVSVNVRTLK
ncbi:discoidin domain-containing protein, partial [Clostridium sp.]|uniref:discoidin domain-containing protein n=1 Tax=Clostridium sp. TaxID=1506 RepID=UPI003F3AF62C